MNVSGMTLEGFFLADYERMRTRIKELEDEVARLTSDGYGCIDQHRTCEAVKVRATSTYNIKEFVNNGMALEQLEKAYAMTNDDLWDWATKSYRCTSYGTTRKPISVEHHTYQYTLLINETRGSNEYVTDGKDGSELLEIGYMEEEMVDNLDNWCLAEYLDKLKLAALSLLRENIGYAIRDLKEG